uniref:Uncharacterized protein n=1 Tax=Fagus sylvatica TaxID=28930 RepID=A0A2N9HQA7_FAGSY
MASMPLGLNHQQPQAVINEPQKLVPRRSDLLLSCVSLRCGVHVDCMCCPHQRLGDTQHPGDSMGTLGYDISSGATKYQPPLKFLDLPSLVPDDTLGLEFGLDLPDLGFDLTISEGFDLGSSSMPKNDDSDLGLLLPFPTSYASHSNSMETTNNGFDSTLKGFHGDGYDLSLLPHAYPMGSQDYQPPTVHISLPSSEGLDLPALAFGSTVSEGFDLGSSSMPNNDDSDLGLLPPFPTSYASHSNSMETTNNGFDSTLKGFHGDGYDLSLLPHAYPMGSQDYQPPTVHISLPSSEGLDLPALAFGSTVSEGFDLGSCLMPHNDDSDFNLYPPSKKMRTS